MSNESAEGRFKDQIFSAGTTFDCVTVSSEWTADLAAYFLCTSVAQARTFQSRCCGSHSRIGTGLHILSFQMVRVLTLPPAGRASLSRLIWESVQDTEDGSVSVMCVESTMPCRSIGDVPRGMLMQRFKLNLMAYHLCLLFEGITSAFSMNHLSCKFLHWLHLRHHGSSFNSNYFEPSFPICIS